MIIKPQTVDDYIAGFPPPTQKILRKVRQTIHAIIPEAQEVIKYGIAGYVYYGNLIYFAAYKTHIGVYPVPKGTAAYQKKAVTYRSSKSTLKFPLDKPIPYGLIAETTKYRLKESKARSRAQPSRK